MGAILVTLSHLALGLLMVVAVTAACPVLDNRCFCRYVDTPRSILLQFITCSNMGLLTQVPAFDVSHDDTEMLIITNSTTIIRLQSQAFAYVKAKRLTLRGLDISMLDHLVFSGLEERVISIDLGDNNISHVPYDTFFRLTRLTTLKLDRNRIAALDQSTFHNMLQLQHINLANNLLQHLLPIVFRDLINLQILQLQGNSAVTIPKGLLANLRNLEDLDLSDNRLTEIPSDAFTSLINLKQLSLSGNKIAGILTSSFLRQLRNLVGLNISRNDISALSSDAFHGCQQLIVVDLSNNDITQILPYTFSALTSLELLDFSANLIESIADNLFDMNNSLTELDLSDNVLVDVGQFLVNVSRLRRLDLSRNFLSEIRMSSFVTLVNLIYLDVRHNQLKGQLDGRLLPQLEEFMIDSNNVTGVELHHPSLRLVRLTVSSNSLTELPHFFHAPQLALLDVTNNGIGAVTDISFACCKHLQRLRLGNNRVTSISVGAFLGLSMLTEIDLSDNRLRYLPAGLFRSCSALSVIDLSRNELTALDGETFAGPISPSKLDISWNKLTTFTTDEVYLALVRLSLSGNPLHCDCQLTWLTTYSALVEHNTTICCPQHDVRPAVCRYVVCESRSMCPPVDAASMLPVNHSSICAQTVPPSVIELIFQPLTTTLTFTHTDEVISEVDVTSRRVLPSISSQPVDVVSNSTSTVCREVSSADVSDCIVVMAVILPLLVVGLTLAVVAVVCMRRRTFVDWNHDEKNCSATAVTLRSDSGTGSDVVTSHRNS